MRKAISPGPTEEGTPLTPPASNRRPDHTSPPGTPRWVKVSVIIFIAVVLIVVILNLTGHGFGNHMRMSIPTHMATREHGGQLL